MIWIDSLLLFSVSYLAQEALECHFLELRPGGKGSAEEVLSAAPYKIAVR